MEVVLVSFLEKLGTFIVNQGGSILDVSDDIQWLQDELNSMRSFLTDAEMSSLDELGIKAWVKQVRDVVYDAEDVIDTIFERDHRLVGKRRVLSWLTTSACFIHQLRSRREAASKIRGIRAKLEEISRRKSQYKIERRQGTEWDEQSINGSLHLLSSSPLVHEGNMVGVEKDVEIMLEWLLGGELKLGVIYLVGMGGVGKTTLVKKVYNHNQVCRHFDRRVWVHVSHSLSIRKFMEEMARGLLENPMDVKELSESQLQERISCSLYGLRYMIVLDDVWNVQACEVLKLILPNSEHGSRVIITTRNNNVASSSLGVTNQVHNLHPLSTVESWTLFCNKAFHNYQGCPQQLEELAKEIVRKCEGLPLAIVTIGGLMSRKERSQVEWKRAAANIHRDLTHNGDGIREALQMSYNNLPGVLKPCFLYCSMFPQDTEISSKRLIRLWVAEGYVKELQGESIDDIAENYLRELINRSMFQVAKVSTSGRVKAFRVHDLLHQLATSISEKESFGIVCMDPSIISIDGVRRVSVQKNCDTPSWKRSKLRSIRSFFLFGSGEVPTPMNHLLQSFELLRVLDLENALVSRLPTSVGKLVHLRYLGLKGTGIKRLPKSVKNLHNLQTLDVRKTQLRKLSFGISNMHNLRHLEMRQLGHSINVPRGLKDLNRLQVVTGLQASRVVVQELTKLTQLRKLGIEDVRPNDMPDICLLINRMKQLSSLTMFSEDDKPLLVGELVPPTFLQKLHLVGRLGALPSWFGKLQNLTKLRLGVSRLSKDPMPTLEALPNLSFLQLYDAYNGVKMRCRKFGFFRLKVMILTELEELEEWTVDEGAMPSIQELWIMSCSSLKTVPGGFMFLTSLQKLRLVGMPTTFQERLHPSEGEDFPKIQHIPNVQLLDL